MYYSLLLPMRFGIIFVVVGITIVGCKKEKVAPVTSSTIDYYQTDGNFLILVIGDTFESAYEYDLTSIQLSNDSLTIDYQSEPDVNGIYDYQYWILQPNLDTLFWSYSNSFTFEEEQINSSNLLSLDYSLVFDSNQFQIIGTISNINLEDLWGKVSQLDIIKTYRELSPNSKIGVSKQVVYSYDDQLGFSSPQLKYFLYMVK